MRAKYSKYILEFHLPPFGSLLGILRVFTVSVFLLSGCDAIEEESKKIQEAAKKIQEEAKLRIAPSELSLSALDYKQLFKETSFHYLMSGRITNKSEKHSLDYFVLNITAQDCIHNYKQNEPELNCTDILRQNDDKLSCAILGTVKTTIKSAIPPGQARDFEGIKLSFDHNLKFRGCENWSYTISEIYGK